MRYGICLFIIFLKLNLNLVYINLKFIFIAVCLDKSHVWENSGSWDMGQNALLTISPEKNDDFFPFHINSLKLKLDWKILRWEWL